MKHFFLILLFLIGISGYTQDDVENSCFGSSFIFSGGQPNYQNGDEGLTYGIDYIFDINDKWEIDLFFQQHKNDERISNKHSHFGINLGRRHNLFSKLYFHYGFGIGYTNRDEKEARYLEFGPVMNGWFGSYRDGRWIVFVNETRSFSTNMKLDLSVKITKHFSAGTFMRTAWGKDLNFATVNGYIGMHF